MLPIAQNPRLLIIINQVDGYFLYREKYLTLPSMHGACMCEGPPTFFTLPFIAENSSTRYQKSGW